MNRKAAKRLILLNEIAEIKATRAKAAAAEKLHHLQGLEAQRSEILARKARVQPALHDPATAAQAARWLVGCDLKMRDLSADAARARAVAETTRECARFEEGRRQVLKKLGDQAS